MSSLNKINLIIPSLIMLLFLFSYSFFSISNVYGHKEIKVGNYTLEAGWEEEPPLLNLLNKIVVYVFDENDNPVRNAMKDLSPSISYGGVSKGLNFIPSEESAGLYVSDIIPSKLGSYILGLKGAIGTQSVNNEIQIEDVEDANRITFPVVSGGSGANIENIAKQITPIMSDLSNQIDELKNEINSTKEIIQKSSDEANSINSEVERTNILSYIAVGLGASAIILVGFMQKIKKT
jgi:outer membrane murein-binding lipoprotein Lpp